LQLIVSGIDKTIMHQQATQKVNDATQAMKIGKYRLANQLYLDAIELVPDKKKILNLV
jgi:hypothetical protein